MKTIPVCLSLCASLMALHAEPVPEGDAPRVQRPFAEGEKGRGPRPEGNRQRPDFDAMWKHADANGDGSVSKEEFFALERISRLEEEKREKIFTRLDKNGDGALTRDELELADKDRHPMPRLAELDKDKDGSVTYEEFSASEFVQKMPEDRRAAFFKRMDRDGDGVLTVKDRPKPEDREGGVFQRLAELDTDKNGGISFEEFSAAEFAKRMPEERRAAFFKRMDRDGDGQLTAKDKPKPDERGGDRREGGMPGLRELVGKLDSNRDGSLSFDEFKLAPFAANWSEDKQEEYFQKLDRNKDNKIDATDAPPPAPGGQEPRRDGPKPPPRGDGQRPNGPPPGPKPGDDEMMDDI